MTPRERAHAQAINEFEAMHGGPAEWAAWEQREYALFVPLREERLLNAALGFPEQQPASLPIPTQRSTT